MGCVEEIGKARGLLRVQEVLCQGGLAAGVQWSCYESHVAVGPAQRALPEQPSLPRNDARNDMHPHAPAIAQTTPPYAPTDARAGCLCGLSFIGNSVSRDSWRTACMRRSPVDRPRPPP